MDSRANRKKRWYPLVYRVYRRIRYLRYIKRRNKLIRRDLENDKRQEKLRLKLEIKEHVRVERRQEKLRLKLEKEQIKKDSQLRKQELRQQQTDFRREFKEKEKEVQVKEIHEKKLRKRRIRRLLRVYIKLLVRNMVRSLSPRSVSNAYKDFRSRGPERLNFMIISFNSTLYFLLSYFFAYFIFQVTTIIASSIYHYPVIVYYYQLYFNITENQWFHDSVKTIFSAGPLISLFMGIIFITIYSRIKEMELHFKLFFLWGFVHFMTMFFGAMLVGTLFDTGLGYVISWMYIMDTGKLLYSIISLFFLTVSGFLLTRSFMISANAYYNELTKSNRRSFMFAQVLVPFITGTLVLIAIRQPVFMFYETYMTITMVLILLPVMATYRNYHELFFDEKPRKIRILWPLLLVLLVTIALYRFGLAGGIPID